MDFAASLPSTSDDLFNPDSTRSWVDSRDMIYTSRTRVRAT